MRSDRHRYFAPILPAIFYVTVTFSVSLTTASVRSETVPAQPAHSFVNSVGLNTKFGWRDTTYQTHYPQVKARLAELGIRHIRDIVSHDGAISTYKELYTTLGVRLLPIADLRTGSGTNKRLDPSQIQNHIDRIRTKLGTPLLVGIEGPNEANIQERDFGYTEWPTDLRLFQETLYRIVHADPAFAGKKIIQPSIGGPNSNLYYARMGDYSKIADIGNLHGYSNWLPWETAAIREYDYAQNTMPGRSFWMTETGWHTSSVAQSLDRVTMLRYFPRALVGFNSFRNLKRGYIYQLADPAYNPNNINYNFGLLDYRGNPKPGFYAVRNMMHVLCDNPLQSTPGSLKYSLSGNPADVRTMLYQKNNGAFYLAIWLEKRGKAGLSPTQSKNIIYPPQAVTVKFEQGIGGVRRYEPSDPDGDVTIANSPKQLYSSPQSLVVSVRDSVTILEIIPSGVAWPAVKKSCAFKTIA